MGGRPGLPELFIAIIGGALYGVIGGAITAVIYNAVAGVAGGIELQVSCCYRHQASTSTLTRSLYVLVLLESNSIKVYVF